ncbi:MAG: ParB/RepB/Spo0J family partition protein [Culicoidibacterales bacterium]
MSKETKRLGKGIEALFTANTDLNLRDIADTLEQIEGYQIKGIMMDSLRANPYQPRKTFDEIALNELADSIREHGIIQPIVVRKSLFGYDILAGERRFRAAKLAGLTEIPAVIKAFTDEAMMELAILENIQREDLNIIEEARGYETLIQQLDWTQQVLAQRMGKSRVHVTNVLRLLKLPPEIQTMLETKELSMGHAKVLLGLEENLMFEIAQQSVSQKLSVRQTEKIVQQFKNRAGTSLPQTPENREQKPKKDIELSFVEGQLIQYLSTKVDITNKKIIIDYAGDTELNRILGIIGMLNE